MTAPALLLTHDGTLAYEDGGAGGIATGAGALRYRDGYFAGTQAALVEEATTQRVVNPYFYIDINNWTQTGATLTRDTVNPYYGAASMKVVSTASAAAGPYTNAFVPASAGQAVTVSAVMKGNAGGETITIYVSQWNGGSFLANIAHNVVLTTGWARYTFSTTIAHASTTQFRVYIGGTGGTTPTWWLGWAQIELKDHGTSLAPEIDGSGSPTTGYAFTGPAHSSPSTRAAASITVPYSGAVGSVYGWYSEDFGATWQWLSRTGTGAIGTYGDISQSGGNLVITSTRALLLGPLAVYSDDASAHEAALQALPGMWTWGDLAPPPPEPPPPYVLPPVIAPLATLTTPQDALDARRTTPRGTCYIGGTVTPYLDYSLSFRVGQTATGRLTIPLPRPAWVQPNAEVVIEGGHNDLVGTYFAGYIPRLSFAMTARGDTLELTLVGHSRRLTKPFRDDMVWQGPVDAGQVFADICDRAGVPSWIAHAALFPSGATLTLGGNPNVDDGTVTIEANSSPLAQFARLVRPFGYYVTDTPSGAVLFHRILGTPSGTPVVSFAEGVHLGDTRRVYDTGEIVNVWDVHGITYTDVYGGQVPIRSVADPAEVEPHPEVLGDGYSYEVTQNSDLVRPDQADAARNVAEIERGAADAPVSWEAVAVPFLAPGDVVAVDAETVEASGSYWLMALDISDDAGGHTASYDGWAGAGEDYPGIVDRTTQVIQVGPLHTGDEYVAHYAQPSPVGTEYAWPFSLPDRVTVANVRGFSHSYNSQTLSSGDSELTVTRWEIWEAGVDRANDDNRPVSSGTMPHQAERYYSGINFSTFVTAAGLQPGDEGYVVNAGEWVPFAVNLRSLDPGDYVLVLKNGEAEAFDDGEVRAVYLELYGLTVAAGG